MDYDHEPFHRRMVVNPTIRLVDIVIALIRREVDDILPRLPSFYQAKLYITHDLPQIFWDKVRSVLDYIFQR